MTEVSKTVIGETTPDNGDEMYKEVYFAIQAFLDEALGGSEDDGAGAGLEGDVRPLAAQRDSARAELATLRESRPERSAELPEGEYAHVEIMGHDYETGWVTDGTRAGVPVMVIRDHDGRVIREVPGHALFTFVPLATPLKHPEPPRAIGVAVDGWDGAEDSVYDDGESPAFDEAERMGEPF